MIAWTGVVAYLSGVRTPIEASHIDSRWRLDTGGGAMEGLRLVAKGAEADLWLDPDWNGVKALVKRRGEKKYRNPELDREIRRSRTIREASIIHRAKKAGVSTPRSSTRSTRSRRP